MEKMGDLVDKLQRLKSNYPGVKKKPLEVKLTGGIVKYGMYETDYDIDDLYLVIKDIDFNKITINFSSVSEIDLTNDENIIKGFELVGLIPKVSTLKNLWQ
ncbi:hypothetical protein [Leptospira licerasiae]|uniref:hypothetical protein n=1 Tax=Leptospira licerasiae TaxID=447106 RepID=UPI00301AB677